MKRNLANRTELSELISDDFSTDVSMSRVERPQGSGLNIEDFLAQVMRETLL